MPAPDLVDDPSVVVSRVHARILVSDGDRVLAVGDAPVLPGGSPVLPDGPRREWPDLSAAAAEQARRNAGVTARVGDILAVTVSADSGLTLVFDAQADDPGGAHFVEAALVPGAVEALEARRSQRIVYSETLWWTVQPSGGGRGLLPSGLGELLRQVTDDDVASWSLGVLLGIFPTDQKFSLFKGIWWSNTGPMHETGEALHQVLMALARAGVLDEDAELEFSWAARVDVR